MKKIILGVTLLLSISAFAENECGLVTSLGMAKDSNLAIIDLTLENSDIKISRIVNTQYLPVLLKGLNSPNLRTCILEDKLGITLESI